MNELEAIVNGCCSLPAAYDVYKFEQTGASFLRRQESGVKACMKILA
jgi:hypothetical protein